MVDGCGRIYSIIPSTVANDWTFTAANITESCAGGVVLNGVTSTGTIPSPYSTIVRVSSTPPSAILGGGGQTVSSYPYTITGTDATTNPLYIKTTITDACGMAKSITSNMSFTIAPGTLKFNSDCSTAKLTVTPSGVYTSPVTYVLSPDPGLGSNTTGSFNNIPDGTYTVKATDACGKVATYNLSNAISHWWKLYLTVGNSCNVGTYFHQMNVPGKAIGTVTFTQYAGPKPITSSSTVLSTQTANAPGNPSTDYSGAASYVTFYNTPAGQTFTYVAVDACGYSDTATVTNGNVGHQPTMHVTTVKNKCINMGDIIGSWNNDGAYYDQVVVKIWNINNPNSLLLNYSSGNTSNTATYPNGQTLLTNQPTGTYVVQYSLTFCTNNVYYDTVTVATYVQPSVSTIQSFTPCSGGGTPVIVSGTGGVAPYTFALVSTTPGNYSSPAQTNPVFTLPTSQNTATVRILDACLNSTTRTVAITKATAPIVRPNIASLSACSLPLSFNLKIDSLYAGSVFAWTKITGTNAGSTVLSTRPTLPIVYNSVTDTATYQVNVTVPNSCYNVSSTFDVTTVAITCSPVISGNVFDDANGLVDNIVNGTPTNAGGLNAILVDGNNQVIAASPVASNGTYSFLNIPQGTYSIILSTTSGTVGSAAPSPSLPSGWLNTGENIGSGTGSDGTVNGILPNITVGTASIANLNFGIEQTPVAKDVSSAPQNNPGGTKRVTVPTLNGSDPEDGTYDGVSNINTIIINSLPTNGTLYYNNVAVILGQTIANYNPTLLTLDPNDGAITVTFTYNEVDAAGAISAPATVTMPFTLVSTLPIELIEFDAIAVGKTSKLSWQVTAQSNVRKFEIQSSTSNSSSFTTIGTVNAQAASDQVGNYSWVDAAPAPGVTYYRLKMTDTYGVVTYSPVKSVRFDAANGKGLNIYPVPAIITVQIELPIVPEAGLVVQLYDDQDRLVNSIPLNQRQTLSLNVQSLSSGVYIVKVMKNTTTVYTGRMIKL